MKFKYLSKEKMEKIPKTPGVYCFRNTEDILYIGKAANLRDRVKNHFPASPDSSRARRGGQQLSFRDSLFIDQVEKIGYITTDSEIEALLLESQLIKQKKPRHNIMWRDDKNYFFVAITQEEFPRVFLTHQPSHETRNTKHETYASRFMLHDSRYIGPFVDGKAIKRTLRSLRKVFPYYTSKHGPRPCQYCHLGLCPGPPAGGPDKKEYRKNIKNLEAVLRGQKPAVLKKLKKQMNMASKNQDYEEAGKLRDQLRDLELLFQHAKVLRPTAMRAPLNWSKTEGYVQKILQTTQKISRVEAYDISNIQGKEATGSLVVFMQGKPSKEHYRKFRVRIAGKSDDVAMLQEVISRRLAHAEWQYPDLMLIDGGKGQLTAALRAVNKFQVSSFKFQENSKPQISNIHIAAIAKRHNELFLPRQSKPLLLKDMPQDVSNFILHMRDEAHRFAVAYHRLLRKKQSIPHQIQFS